MNPERILLDLYESVQVFPMVIMFLMIVILIKTAFYQLWSELLELYDGTSQHVFWVLLTKTFCLSKNLSHMHSQ